MSSRDNITDRPEGLIAIPTNDCREISDSLSLFDLNSIIYLCVPVIERDSPILCLRLQLLGRSTTLLRGFCACYRLKYGRQADVRLYRSGRINRIAVGIVDPPGKPVTILHFRRIRKDTAQRHSLHYKIAILHFTNRPRYQVRWIGRKIDSCFRVRGRYFVRRKCGNREHLEYHHQREKKC